MRTQDTSNENTEREDLLETEHRGRELRYETTQQLGALDALPEVLGSPMLGALPTFVTPAPGA